MMKLRGTLSTLCALCALGATACTTTPSTPDQAACDMPATPRAVGPIMEAASHLSHKPAVVFVARDLRSMVAASRKLTGLEDPATRAAFYKTFEREFAKLEGSPFELEFFTSAGVDTSAPALFAISDEGPAVVVKLADREAWINWLTNMSGQTIEAAPDLKGNVSRLSGGGDAMWTMRDDYVCFTWDDDDAMPVMCSGASRGLARTLDEEPGFNTFVSEVMGDSNVGGMYVAARGDIMNDVSREFLREGDIDTMRVANLFGSLTGFGLAGRFEGDALEGRAWAGVGPAAAKTLERALTAPSSLDLSDSFGDAILFARVSVDPSLFGFYILDLFNADSQEDFEEFLTEVKQRLDIELDVTKDLFARSGGHAWFAIVPTKGPAPQDSIRARDFGGYAVVFGLDTPGEAETNALHDMLAQASERIPFFVGREIDGVRTFSPRNEDVPVVAFEGDRVVFSYGLSDDEIITTVRGGGVAAEGAHARATSSAHGLVIKPRDIADFVFSRSERPLVNLLPKLIVATAAPSEFGVLADVSIPSGAFLADLPDVIAESKRARVFDEIEWHMRSLTDSCRSYFQSEQRYSAPNGREPWHDAIASNSTVGFPVPFTDYTFPGGVNFKITNMPSPPRNYDSSPSAPSANQHQAAVLDMIYGPFRHSSNFRYTLETGPGTGTGATCTITAEADLDPTTSELHTITSRVTVDSSTLEVLISPPVTTNEGQ